MIFLETYGYFLICTITIVLAILAVIGGILVLAGRAKEKGQGYLSVKHLNAKYDELKDHLNEEMLSKSELKTLTKAQKKQKKAAKTAKDEAKPRLFVLRFEGDMQASGVNSLTQTINAIILIAKKHDRVLACIESPGGVVHGYGLAASQIQRLIDAKLHVTAAIDKVAASGGYMMACVANQIISAPFAIIGSIGVVAQLPNFSRWLKKKDIDFEQLTAGQYKRTLTLFGENTDEGREKMQEEINETQVLFKSHVGTHRPNANMDTVATGEHWYGTQALDLQLVDHIQTSDSYLLDQQKDYNLYEIEYKMKQKLSKRFALGANALLTHIFN
jgi:serine protease SohB